MNARPLVAMLECDPDLATLVEAVPSRLAGMLERREVSAALVSSVVPLLDPGLCAFAVGAVTSDGPVLSVRLMTRVPVRRIRRLALDVSSRTSVILVQILLQKRYGLTPELVSLPPDIPCMLESADAAVIIGDPAMKASVAAERGELPLLEEDVDLGLLWKEITGLPFVYAMWTAPRDDQANKLFPLLERAAHWGSERLDQIGAAWAPRLGLSRELCVRYLRENIHYVLGPREREGLYAFYRYGVERGLLPERPHPLEYIAEAG